MSNTPLTLYRWMLWMWSGGPHPGKCNMPTGFRGSGSPRNLLVVIRSSFFPWQVLMGVDIFGNRELARWQVVRYQIHFTSVLEVSILRQGQRCLFTAHRKATGGWVLWVLLSYMWREAIAIINIQGIHTVKSCGPDKCPNCARTAQGTGLSAPVNLCLTWRQSRGRRSTHNGLIIYHLCMPHTGPSIFFIFAFGKTTAPTSCLSQLSVIFSAKIISHVKGNVCGSIWELCLSFSFSMMLLSIVFVL